MQNETRTDGAKERVEQELSELNVKIVKITTFLYSDMPLKSNLSHRMIVLMKSQLEAMERYAEILQERLSIWGMTDGHARKRLSRNRVGQRRFSLHLNGGWET